ncbi:MAG: alkaline phosphatase D family protein [Cyclobacteriaceae bacterium]|jgi:alkaline phosphatase D|nr:alkaline phosphatase D family protein [Cyclobacteriaceae bacterium]
MKGLPTLGLLGRLSLLVALTAVACSKKEAAVPRLTEEVAEHFDPALKPFYHGVASGDPLADRVILWTRVTPDTQLPKINVAWEVAEDEAFASIYRTDTTSTHAARDYTVKVDVDGLKPGRKYFYRFKALNATSPVGQTKTTPTGPQDSLKLAIVSCSNWEWGFFNAYDKIANRTDVDAVIHLGDYIYEYGQGKYGDTTIRKNLPTHEIVTLQDYRTRHSLYRLDKGLRRLSQRHPMIAIWDDHEVANNVYTTGAQNHQPGQEGDFAKRREAAVKAYYEWLPIRESAKHYRAFSYGSLADVFMLDERLEGRTKPADSMNDPAFLSEEQTMLGQEQLAWFENGLKNSTAQWKVVGNQVIFADVELSPVYPKMPRNLDSWDGYPKEKARLVETIRTQKIQDIIFITGDTHASWAIEAATEVKKTYNPQTSKGAFAVELGTTSVSSANDNEYHSTDTVRRMEEAMRKANPHVKYLNARDHGYLLLTLYPQAARGEWYYMESLRQPETSEVLGKRVRVKRGQSRIE